MATMELLGRNAEGLLGLRLTADEFLALPEDSVHYELVDGVVVMSPSPSFWHQDIIGEILVQLRAFLDAHPIGKAVADIDVKLTDDLVYRPDIAYLSMAKTRRVTQHLMEAPDLVIEVISSGSRGYDSRTKRRDYEAAGVGEYWLIDPERKTFTFLVLRDGAFHDASSSGPRYPSVAVPGFEFDLDRVRRLF